VAENVVLRDTYILWCLDIKNQETCYWENDNQGKGWGGEFCRLCLFIGLVWTKIKFIHNYVYLL